ncbi:radical SAM/SPASM domain-containing protein [Brumimicrobium oceani]|uniref:Radical SAM protein n=1 Tax=Brumimicrobium oceani TaxID=2100725 RepID=A0A2U2XD25_9FLAO|nr:radical SAM/SPASM domain-containing protein [Brumimicrobium oceani]PWH85673.1 radical SAM protein [Brumimicrobium oceani]
MWSDQRNIIAKITFSRIWNLILLYYSYFLAKNFKKIQSKGLPFAASIEPTTACNLGCPECPSGLKQFTRATGKLDLNEHILMLDQLGNQLFYINYYFQGEPFLHPQFLELIKEANHRKIYTATSTNAHFITQSKAEEIVDSGLDRMIISIDGLTQETYEQYRKRGKLEKVIEGTQHMIEAKKKAKSKTPHLIFQFLVVKANEHEIDDVFKLGKSLGVDEVRLKTAQLYDYKNGNPLMPKNEKYARYKRMKDGTYRSKYTISNHCWRMWSSTVLTWDGKVVPCCFDKDAQHVLGDVLRTDFINIWSSAQYQSFRYQVFTDRSQIDICKNCSEGAKVWT